MLWSFMPLGIMDTQGLLAGNATRIPGADVTFMAQLPLGIMDSKGLQTGTAACVPGTHIPYIVLTGCRGN